MTSTDDTPTRPRRLGYDLLRIASICGVVAIHIFGPTAANQNIRGSISWHLAVLFSVGFIWAVPVFVMLSGALSLRPEAHANGVRAFYAKRAKRLIPAIIVWTFTYLVLVRMLLLHEVMSRGQIVEDLVDARVYPHLYFLWLIGGLYLIAPVFAAFLGNGSRRRALGTAAVALILTLVIYMIPNVLGLFNIARPLQMGALTIWILYVGYFLAGYALSRYTPTVRWIIAAAIGIPLLGGITIAEAVWPDRLSVLRAFATPEYLGFVVAALAICVMTVGVNLLDRVRFGKRMTRFAITLSEASFGVFLIHFVVLLIPYELLRGFHVQRSLSEAMLAYIFVVVISFALSIGARKIPLVRAVF